MNYKIIKKINQIIDKEFPEKTITNIPIDDFIFNFLHMIGIYLLFSNKKIIYIGVTDDLGNRIKSHFDFKNYGQFRPQSLKDYGKKTDKIKKIKIARFSNWQEAAYVESLLILKFHPKYNKRTNHYYPFYEEKKDIAKSLRKLTESFISQLQDQNY